MAHIEPVHNQPAAVIEDEERLLVIADYHAGFEIGLRYEEGVELRSRAPERKQRLLRLIEETGPDRLIILGDVTHSIGEPRGGERAELEVLFADLNLPVTIAKGNHDGAIETYLASDHEQFGQVSITASGGARLGSIGIAHGHTWPDPGVLDSNILCIGHEHPCVRLIDEVGGTRVERAWVRGTLHAAPFEAFHECTFARMPELVIFPTFNDLTGGTWVNDPEQAYLAPFLPDSLKEGSIYLLDGTNLGSIRAFAS